MDGLYFAQDTLCVNEYIARHVEGAGQMLGYAMSLKPNSVTRLITMMKKMDIYVYEKICKKSHALGIIRLGG